MTESADVKLEMITTLSHGASDRIDDRRDSRTDNFPDNATCSHLPPLSAVADLFAAMGSS